MKIAWQAQGHLSEAVSTAIEMALIDAEGKALHPPVRCKDFLSDAYYSEAVNKEISIWGFRWTPGTLDRYDRLRIAVRRKGTPLTNKHMIPMTKLMGAFSSLGDVTVSTDEAGSMLLVADSSWATSPWRISLFTMLIRQGLVYDGTEEPYAFLERIAREDNPLCPGDKRWVEGTLVPMKKLMEGEIPPRLAKKDSFTAFATSHACHHSGGIYASWTGESTG